MHSCVCLILHTVRSQFLQDNDADPTLQFKDVKELDSKDNSHKIIGLAYIAPPPQGVPQVNVSLQNLSLR